ncbi:hypothetical protein ACLQ2E_17820 [Streptomyces lavendulocolor]
MPDMRTELEIGGVWTTEYPYDRDPVVISAGRREHGTAVEASKLTLTLPNRDGTNSPRNPMSPRFGLIGSGTPIRFSVQGPESYLRLRDSSSTGIAATPDAAALDVTGDLDVRVEATAFWRAPNTRTLIGKWDATSGQRSYMLNLSGGALQLRWSTDGTANWFAGALLPALPERAAVRATIDVDNGAGGYTVRMYWAASLDGPWTEFTSPISAAGVTSIHAGTAPLQIGPTSLAGATPFLPMEGRVHRAEVRDGIGGTAVASPDFRALAEGTTSFADAAGRTWSVTAPAEVSDREYLFTGETTKWQPRRSGTDAYVLVEAGGIMSRQSQGKTRKMLASTLRRRVPSGNPLSYWPMEEGENATQAYSAVPQVLPLTISGFDWAADDTLGGSSPLPKLGASASFRGPVRRSSASGWHAEMVYYLPALPAAQTEILRVTVVNSVMRTAIVYASTAGVRVEVLDTSGDIIVTATYSDPAAIAQFAGRWNRLAFFTSDDGGGVTRLTARWRDINGVGGASWTTTVFTGVQGAAIAVSGTYGAATEGMTLGHLAVFDVAGTSTTPGVTIYDGADDGFAGESAIDRLYRLTTEEAVPFRWVDGDITQGSEAMGPQRPGTLPDLLQECADTDGGILYEDRERLGLVYRDRSSLYNQTTRLTLDYSGGSGDVKEGELLPSEDIAHIFNDVTVTRLGGSSAHLVLEEGRLSVQDPPDGVGVRDEQVERSLALDTQAEQIAAWRLHLGTWDEARYPSVPVQLHKAKHLIPDVLALTIGDRAEIVNMPKDEAPDDLVLLVQGYEHTLSLTRWDWVANCTPGRPWDVGILEDSVLGRLDTDGAVLGAAADAAATALEVHSDTAVGPRWVDSAGYPAEFPFDVRAGGERMTVSAITNRADTFTRTVSNTWDTSSSGIVWAESGGAASDRSVTGTRGVITLASGVSTLRFQRLVTTPVADAEVRVRLSVSAVATGASAVPGVLLRYVDGNTYYRARVHFGTGGSMFVSVTRDTTQIGASPALPYTYSAGSEYELRVRLAGHTVQMKVWPVGTAEPGAWNHTETVVTNTIPAGQVGVTGSAFAGLTNVGLQLLYDQFEVVTPQRFTVVRAVNGISKAHAAGTDVSLQDPMRLAH